MFDWDAITAYVISLFVLIIIPSIVQIVFIIQKLAGVIDWSWFKTLCILEGYAIWMIAGWLISTFLYIVREK